MFLGLVFLMKKVFLYYVDRNILSLSFERIKMRYFNILDMFKRY